MRRLLIWVIAPLVVVLAAGLVVALIETGNETGGQARPGSHRTISITASDGVRLAANLAIPAGAGRDPLVVMPTAWGAEQSQYQNIARMLVADGFVVVAYKQRGFDHLGGAVDFAGPRTVTDASQVIDWALAHTRVDPNRIGMLGVSYGAGVSLLAAEHDPRIKAVVAFSTWTDWGASFAPNSTVSTGSLATLFAGARAKGVLSPELNQLASVYRTDPAAAVELIHSLSAVRSPITDVAALNKNHTAVMLANGMQDSIFAPQQLADFYRKLTGPRRLQLAVGDHTQPELEGFVTGRHVGPVGDAVDWLTHYLAGHNNGIDRQQPIELEDATTQQMLGFTSWPSATSAASYALPLPGGSTNLGPSAAEWAAAITTGTDTAAASLPLTVNLTAPYRFANADLTGLGAHSALLWTALTATAPLTVVGTCRLDIDVASSSPTASFFVYLYDVLPGGGGTLMSVTPETVAGLTSSTATPLSIDLTPTAWTLPTGDRLMVVIDTVDGRWSSQSPLGSTIEVSSTLPNPASLSLAPTG
jgi:predicted acyl esterase